MRRYAPADAGLIRLIKNIYFLAIAGLTPVVAPTLPFNTAVLDYVNIVFMTLFFVYLLFRRTPLEFRLTLPAFVILFGSLIAMLDGQALPSNCVTIAQEAYLFAYFFVLLNIITDERDLRILTLLWIVFAAAEGGLVLSDLSGAISVRGQGTFLNPNMAGSYLAMSAFLILQPYFKLNRMVQALVMALMLGGLFATKSLSAMLAFAGGGLVVFLLYWCRSDALRRVKLGIAASLIALGGIVALLQATEVHNFLDRFQNSEEGREVIWSTGLDAFLKNPLGLGVGPAGFVQEVVVAGGPWGAGRSKGLHNDYLAFLVERGVIGFAGLLLLLGALGSILRHGLGHAGRDRQFLWAAALCGMFVFNLIDSVNHEVLHYRHVWLMFALIAAAEKLAGRRSSAMQPFSGARLDLSTSA
jgi:O-antigen ligase